MAQHQQAQPAGLRVIRELVHRLQQQPRALRHRLEPGQRGEHDRAVGAEAPGAQPLDMGEGQVNGADPGRIDTELRVDLGDPVRHGDHAIGAVQPLDVDLAASLEGRGNRRRVASATSAASDLATREGPRQPGHQRHPPFRPQTVQDRDPPQMKPHGRLDHQPRVARIGGTCRDAVGADLAPQADAPVGVEQPEGRAEGEVVLERHDRRRARAVDDVEDREGETGELLHVDGVGP